MDFLPEVTLTRLLVSDSTDVNNYVNKLIRYETELGRDKSNYDYSLLLCGSRLSCSMKSHGKHISDAHYRSVDLFLPLLQSDRYTSRNIKCDWIFDTGSSDNTAFPAPLNARILSEMMNRGYNVVHFDGHGNYMEWFMDPERNNKFDRSFASQLSNFPYSVIVTTSCKTNNFAINNEKCLSTSFINNPNGGAIAYMGCSGPGINKKDQKKLRQSWSITTCFFDYLHKNYPFGECAHEAKRDNCHYLNDYSANRHLVVTTNHIGEPFIHCLQSKGQVEIKATINSSGNLEVGIEEDSGCYARLCSFDDLGNSYDESVVLGKLEGTQRKPSYIYNYTFKPTTPSVLLIVQRPYYAPIIKKMFLR